MSYFAYIMSKGTLESFDLSKGAHTFWEDEICLQNQVFPWVLYEFEGKIYVEAKVEGYRVIERGSEFREDMEIYDGMYIEVMEKQGRKSYEIMLMHHRSIQFSHRYYYIEDEIYIGNSSDCEIKSNIPHSLMPEHACIQKQGSRYVVSTLSQQADIYVNGRRYDKQRLNVGDLIWCMGLSIVFLGEYIALSSQGVANLDEYLPTVADAQTLPEEQNFERVPRVLVSLETGTMEILGPTPKERRDIPLHLSLGPAFAMSLGMLVSVGFAVGNVANGGSVDLLITSGFSAGSCLIGALLWPTMLKSNQKKELEKINDRRQKKYILYADGKTHELDEKYNRNKKLWNDILAPSPESLVKMTAKLQVDSRLWERTPGDNDFLALRVGVGSHDFEVEIKLPPESFDPDEDELSKYPHMIQSRFKTLKDVPEVLSIRQEKCVGICGQYEMIWALLKSLIVETMALHHPEDVKTAFFFSDHEKEHFMWVKDLPSVWSANQAMRFMASNRREAETVLHHIVGRIEKKLTKETYVFFVSDRMLLPETEILGSGTRIFYVFINETLADLPRECRAVIRCLNNSAGLYAQGSGESQYVKFTQDEMSDQLLLEFRKALLAVPYTPPSYGHMVRDVLIDDTTVDLIDFAGQKVGKPGEEKQSMHMPEHMSAETDGLIKPVMFAPQDLEKWDEPEEDEYEEVDDEYEGLEEDEYEEVDDEYEGSEEDEYEEVDDEYEESEEDEYEEADDEYEESEEDEYEEVDDEYEESEEDEYEETDDEYEESEEDEYEEADDEYEESDEVEDDSKETHEENESFWDKLEDPQQDEWEDAEESDTKVWTPGQSKMAEGSLESEDMEAEEEIPESTLPSAQEEEMEEAEENEEVEEIEEEIDEVEEVAEENEEVAEENEEVTEEIEEATTNTVQPTVEVREDFLDTLREKKPELGELERMELSSVLFDQGLFISGTHREVVNNLMLTLAKFTKVDYVFSENVGGRCDCLCEKIVWTESGLDKAIEEIREYVWSFPTEKCVILIPSFHAFCSVVSRRGLDRLARVMRKHGSKVALITGETVEYLSQYRENDFLKVAVRQEQGIVTDPEALTELMPFLPEGLELPALQEEQQDFLYYNDKKWNIFFM